MLHTTFGKAEEATACWAAEKMANTDIIRITNRGEGLGQGYH